MSELIGKKAFDIQEAAVLLDVYLCSVSKGETLMKAAGTASARLRALAVRNDLSIPDNFRSPTGLLNRLRSLASIYNEKEIPSAPATGIFMEIVDIYKNDRSRYDAILSSEKKNIENDNEDKGHNVKEMESVAEIEEAQNLDFFQWLQQNTSASECTDIHKSFKVISALLLRKRLLISLSRRSPIRIR